jgi:hypothetical protein
MGSNELGSQRGEWQTASNCQETKKRGNAEDMGNCGEVPNAKGGRGLQSADGARVPRAATGRGHGMPSCMERAIIDIISGKKKHRFPKPFAPPSITTAMQSQTPSTCPLEPHPFYMMYRNWGFYASLAMDLHKTTSSHGIPCDPSNHPHRHGRSPRRCRPCRASCSPRCRRAGTQSPGPRQRWP